MKNSATPILIAFLLSKVPFFSSDLFTFNFLNSSPTTLRLCSTDQDITDQATGNVFFGSSPALGAQIVGRNVNYPSPVMSRWNLKNTFEVPTLELELLSDGTDYNGVNIKHLAHNGLFDGCNIMLQRAIMPIYGDTSLGLITLFTGPVGPVTIGARGIKLTVKGANVKLQQYMPRNRYQIGCIHALYDAGCTLNRTDFTVSKVVGPAGNTASFIAWDTVPSDPSVYSLGYVTFTSGAAEGQTRTIQSAGAIGDSTGFQMMYPLYNLPSPGDTYTITQGCDKTIGRCTVLNNLQHYRGFPFIPPATAAA